MANGTFPPAMASQGMMMGGGSGMGQDIGPIMPAMGTTLARQARRLYVGNLPFGVTEVGILDSRRFETMILTIIDIYRKNWCNS
jgi:hypothetical protein